jgi:hypothetical protein
MRKVVLTAFAALVLLAFTFSGCKKEQPVTKPAPTTKAPAPAPAPAPSTEKPAAPAPTTPGQ